MKRTIITLLIYIASLCVLCVGIGFVFCNVPELLPYDVRGYRLLTGFSWFLELMPTIFFSGFSIVCCIAWKYDKKEIKHRFSSAMMENYRWVLLFSLVMVLCIALNAEVFKPGVSKKLAAKRNAPVELASAISTANEFLEEEKPSLAYQYARKALAVAPKDEEAAQLFSRVVDSMAIVRDRQHHEDADENDVIEEVHKPLQEADRAYSVAELLEKSRLAYAEKNWVNAHYWAKTAVEICSGTDTNRSEAIQLANDAWNMLSQPLGVDMRPENLLYRRKSDGYKAYNSGDFLESYYAFLSLHDEAVERNEYDPDVERYLALAKEEVQSAYFFLDETDDMNELENAHDVYFAVGRADGGKDVVFVRGVMDIRRDGRYLRYLEGVTVVSYDKNGDFIRSMQTPFAKVYAQNVNIFDVDTRIALGIPKGTKIVPVVMLQAVDRNTKGIVSMPVYSYEQGDIPAHIRDKVGFVAAAETPADNADLDVEAESVEAASSDVVIEVADEETVTEKAVAEKPKMDEPTLLVLPIDYQDMDVISYATESGEYMPIVYLRRFMAKATDYGFPSEKYILAFITRLLNPLIMLICFIIAATMAWNYGMENKQDSFHFAWLFLIPLYGGIIYIILDFLDYITTMFTYVMIGMFSTGALPVVFFTYVVLFFIVSMNFLARRSN